MNELGPLEVYEVVSKYQQNAERTSSTATFDGCCRSIERMSEEVVRLLHAGMGLGTEAGEFNDQLKRHIFYGAPLDRDNLKEECGDIMWYVAECLNSLGADVVDVMQKNIEKLRARYPDRYDDAKAVNRDLDEERKALES